MQRTVRTKRLIAYTHLDGALERPVIELLEDALDVTQIDLAATDDDADQRGVIGAHALHGTVQSAREVQRPVLHALHCRHTTLSQ